MKRILTTVGTTLSLGMFLIAFNIGGLGGCGGESGAGGGGGGGTATSAEAESVANAGALVAVEAIGAAFGSGGALTTSSARPTLKNVITATAIGSCDAGDLPVPGSGAENFTVSGSGFSCDGSTGSGSCTVNAEVTEGASSTNVRATIDCTNLIVPVETEGGGCENVSVDGIIGMDADVSSDADTTIDDITLSSESLTIGFADGDSCDVNFDLSLHIVVDNNTGEGTVTASGCISACGDAFEFSGSDVF